MKKITMGMFSLAALVGMGTISAKAVRAEGVSLEGAKQESGVEFSEAEAASLQVGGKRTWNRFITRGGKDINLRLERSSEGDYNGQMVVGVAQVSGDNGCWKGGAEPHVLNIDVSKKRGLSLRLPRKGRIILQGKTQYGDRYDLLIKAGPEGQEQLKLDAIDLRRRTGLFGLFSQSVIKEKHDGLTSASQDLDRTPLVGPAAEEIYNRLEEAGAPDIDLDGADFRGLYVFKPYGQNWVPQGAEVSFDHISVPAQLTDALNGLKALGLSPTNAIFSRIPKSP